MNFIRKLALVGALAFASFSACDPPNDGVPTEPIPDDDSCGPSDRDYELIGVTEF